MFQQFLALPRLVHVLCFGTFINRAGSFFIVFVTIYVSERLGFGERFATLCIGVYGVGSLAAALLGGHLADHIGRRTVMLVSLAGGAAVLCVFPLLATRALLAAAIFIYALLIDMYRPAAGAMVADVVPPQQRGAAFALMYVAINLGFACGAWVGGILSRYSFTLLFLGDATTTFVYAAIIALLIRETLPSRRSAAPAPDAGPTPTAAPAPTAHAAEAPVGPPPVAATVAPAAARPVGIREALGHILRDATYLSFCAGGLLNAVVFMQTMSTLPLYMRSMGFTPEQYGRVVGLNGILIVFAQVPIAGWLGRFERVRVIAAGSLMTGLGFGAHGLAVTGWQFAAAVVVWTVGEMMQAPFNQAVVSDLSPTALRGRYMGVFNMSFSVAMMFGAPLGGLVLARWGGGPLWCACLALSVAACALQLAVRRRVHERSQVAAGAACASGTTC